MTNQARLVFVNGPEDGRELHVPLPCVFGRLTDNDVALPYDALVSRRHARLTADGDRVLLEDLGSRNGTFLLTGEPVRQPTAMTAADLFRVGGTWFRLAGRGEGGE